MKSIKKPSRRELMQAGALAPALSPTASAAPPKISPEDDSVYTRVGVRPFINCTATYTINGGTLTLPEVKAAMDAAGRHSVNLDELMDKVGERIATLLGAEAALVSAGCAAALVHATSACVTGGDPEKMQQLPRMDGLRSEVIMPKQSRNQYDHAIRSVGVRLVEVDTREEFFAALGRNTAMVAVLGTGEAKGKMRLEEIAGAAHKLGVPVLVDAAAELPLKPNPYLSRGADLVGYSGGKIIRGPQCAGLLMGRKDLIRAAWINSSPHHAFGRSMKVGKEEIMGMLAAVEVWAAQRELQSEYRTWESWYAYITEQVTRAPGVRTRVIPPAGASPFPVMEIAWDPEKIGITAGELGDTLLNGDPRIMSHAEGEGFSFILRPVAMKEGQHKLVAARLLDIFQQAPKGRAKKSLRPPAADIAGQWDVEVKFAAGSTRHHLMLLTNGNQVTGTHMGRSKPGPVKGTVDGDRVRFRSALATDGPSLRYEFEGAVKGDAMSGEIDLGEYGRATWMATRLG
jgi:L-seryl-tRNA(Ser) seleniumtransferase